MIETDNDTRLEAIAADLRAALAPIVKTIAGESPRPGVLCRKLGVDKTLAGNLMRALRAEAYYDLLHHVPAPNGLRIFLSAARSARTSTQLLETAEECVDRFQSAIDATPGGWKTLSAAISSHSLEAKDRNEKRAKQAIYRSMSYLLGLQCETVLSAFLLHPASDGETVDCIDISIRHGVRRLRPTHPFSLFDYHIHARGPEAEGDPRITTLDGRGARNATDFVLREFSDDSLPDLEILESEEEAKQHITIALSEDGPSLHSPFTIAQGMFIGGLFHRYRRSDHDDECRTYMLDTPCKLLVRDFFIHRSLYQNIDPEVSLYTPRSSGPMRQRHAGTQGRLNHLDLNVPINLLGGDLANRRLAEYPPYADLLGHAFEQANWDPGEFRGYRMRVTYPVPNIYMSIWFSLSDPPDRG